MSFISLIALATSLGLIEQALQIGSSLYADSGLPQDLQCLAFPIILLRLAIIYLCWILSLVASSLHSDEQYI
jgi:hypothetical protein